MTVRKPKADKALIDQQAADKLKEKRLEAAMQFTGAHLVAAHMQAGLLGDEVLNRSDLTLHEMNSAIKARSTSVVEGNLSGLEHRLATQASSLDLIFNQLASRATMNMGQHLDAAEKYMRLALKAQAQCRSTVEAIHLMHNPTQFIKQTNIAQGHQQVVNGSQAGPEKIETEQNKLLSGAQQSVTAEGLKHDLDNRKAAATV